MPPPATDALVDAYLDLKDVVIQRGFGRELFWQERAARLPLTEPRFLREGAWVILSSGMSYRAVSRRFGGVASALGNLRSGRAVVRAGEVGRRRALQAFNHEGKIDAITALGRHLNDEGLAEVQKGLQDDPVRYLQRFSYLGPATAAHLAKNLGAPIAKPDRHLIRIADAAGFSSVGALCKAIADAVGDPVPVVDLVAWRHATLDSDYLTAWRRAALSSAG